MKFGSTIKQGLYSEWEKYYIDYSGLKKFLKKRQSAHEQRNQATTPSSGAGGAGGPAKDSNGTTTTTAKNVLWDDTDEQEFIKRLQDELTKVSRFQEEKISELHSQINLYSEEVQKLVDHQQRKKESSSKRINGDEDGDGDGDGQQRRSSSSEDTARLGDDEENIHRPSFEEDDSDDDGLDDDEDDDEIEQRFVELEEDLEVLIADVYDLGRFTHLNYTGFIKIVKKHDKRTGWELRGDFVRQYLEKRPFYKENYDALIVQLSKLYNLVRTRGNPVQGDSAAGGAQSAFVRQTTKYWVHPDNYVNLKLAILKHLPVLVFNPDKEFEPKDAAISSIYFDNENLDLYLGRLEKSEGAEAIRLRWYGDMDVKQIFVERKTHREDWTGEKSVKARFPIKENQVNDYLSGKITMDATFEELRKKGKKSNKEIDSMIRLAREVQESIQKKKLCPVVRTFYNRTAFQLPGDARVRISFDAQLSLIREDNWDGKIRSGDNWRRMDIGIDWPFDQLPKDDKELFPYGVLEVKLQTQMGQEPPEWVRELVSSHLVEAVPKFSKFIHGCATLLPNRVDLVPFWLPQMDTDIRKPVTQKKTALIERPTGSNTHTPTTTSDTEPRAPDYTEPLSEDEDENEGGQEDDDDSDPEQRHGKSGDPMRIAATNELNVAGLPQEAYAQAKDARAFREKQISESQLRVPEANAASSSGSREPNGKTASASLDVHKLTPKNLKKLLAQKYEEEESTKKKVGLGDDDESDNEGDSADRPSSATARGSSSSKGKKKQSQGAPSSGNEGFSSTEFVKSFTYSGKRIAVPVRVEPKVNFALERTLLAWVEFSVLLSAIGVGLLEFTGKHDAIGFASAITFTVIALIAICYSGAIFLYRAIAIRRRRAINYDDKYGPTALVVILLTATAVNFALRIAEAF